MTRDSQTSNEVGWLEASGLLHILRSLGLAVHPAKLGVGLLGIILTLVLGGLLDLVWKARGGVEEAAITKFIRAREMDQPYQEAEGKLGIFEVWRAHERTCVLGFLGSSLPGASVATGTPLGTYVEAHSFAGPLRNLAGIVYGGWWMLRHHFAYFVVFSLGVLLIWSWCGGAICRLAAVQFAREEKLTMRQGWRYAYEKLFGGFFLAPCIPLVLIAVTAVCMMVGGVLLRIPWLGDVVGGVLFFLAIIGGFVISILLFGMLVGGNLFWPAVAVEGSDAFDAFSRGLSYPLSKPWKTVLYAVIAIVFASICWVFVNLFTFLMLTVTRATVAFGTSPFGWWSRTLDGKSISKMELLWPLLGPNSLYGRPKWDQLATFEYVSAFLVGLYVLMVIGLVWSFLVSFYFSASTVIYCLLRRDVDGTDLEDVYVEEEESEKADVNVSTPAQTTKAEEAPRLIESAPPAGSDGAFGTSAPASGAEPGPTFGSPGPGEP